MKNLVSLLVMSAFFLSATPSFSQDSDYEIFWKGKIKEIFKQFKGYDEIRGSVQMIKGKTYFIKHIRTDRERVIQVYPAKINKQTKTILIDFEEERFYRWIDDGDNFLKEGELIPDKSKDYFGLEPPSRYSPKISQKNCA